jgi:hypothetical protein
MEIILNRVSATDFQRGISPFFWGFFMVVDWWYFGVFLAGLLSGWAFVTGIRGM